jgi:hypothetical protein
VQAATNLSPHLLKFYVDDQNLVVEELPPGSRLVEGKVEVVETEVEVDRAVPGDRRTALVYKDIANSICPYTKVSVDFPSAHASGWMPLLDLQVRMRQDKTVDWKYYKKKVTSQYCVLNRSAVPAKVKRVALVQEGLRRLRNTRPALVEECKVEQMEDLAEMMLHSGYPEDYRAGVLQAALVGYQRQVEADAKGDKPLYRPREWRQEERRKRRGLRRAAWFRPADTVLFLPATPNSELAGMAREVLAEEGSRLGITVRVVETAGVSLKRQLVRTDLGAGDPCPQKDCTLCLTNPGQGGGLTHHRSGALYTGTCRVCSEGDGDGGNTFSAVYTGESGYSAYTRTLEHAEAIVKKKEDNAFAKHLEEYHPEREGEPEAFTFKVERTFAKPMERQVAEAVKIHRCGADFVLNSKSEWEQPVTDRVVVARELPERRPAGEGRGGGRGGGSRGRGRGRHRGGGGV